MEGLGLAIVKHILEAHDSKVSVISTVGKGSTFVLSFQRPVYGRNGRGGEKRNGTLVTGGRGNRGVRLMAKFDFKSMILHEDVDYLRSINHLCCLH